MISDFTILILVYAQSFAACALISAGLTDPAREMALSAEKRENTETPMQRRISFAGD